MIEIGVLFLFCISIFLCILSGTSVVCALLFGLFMFLLYGRYRGFSWKDLFQMFYKGIITVKNILILFALIGMMTGIWRMSGTIAAMIHYSSALIVPSFFYLSVFLLNGLFCFLTGTAFGTTATIGVFCIAMSSIIHADSLICGGAIVSSAFFGDRLSPFSSSSLLIAQLTDSDVYRNIGQSIRRSVFPFLLSCFLYLFLGWTFQDSETVSFLQGSFIDDDTISIILLLPVFSIVILSIFRTDVRISMSVSILCAVFLCFFVQKYSFLEISDCLLFGYDPSLSSPSIIMKGGGIVSMMETAFIVSISASYTQILQKTGLFAIIGKRIESLASKTSRFLAVFLTAAVSIIVTCSQTMPILLTKQLCEGLYEDRYALAADLEDTAVPFSAFIPWSIAASVPLSTLGISSKAILYAFFLYLLPIYRLFLSFSRKQKY